MGFLEDHIWEHERPEQISWLELNCEISNPITRQNVDIGRFRKTPANVQLHIL